MRTSHLCRSGSVERVSRLECGLGGRTALVRTGMEAKKRWSFFRRRGDSMYDVVMGHYRDARARTDFRAAAESAESSVSVFEKASAHTPGPGTPELLGIPGKMRSDVRVVPIRTNRFGWEMEVVTALPYKSWDIRVANSRSPPPNPVPLAANSGPHDRAFTPHHPPP
jgi:hypothetical protein